MAEQHDSNSGPAADADSGRRSGVLLHPTCLPNRWGIGDLGRPAYDFLDLLHATGQRLWQILPLGPTAESGSPYSALSAVAGNPLLISLDALARDGLLDADEPSFVAPASPVAFQQVADRKLPRLRAACARFLSRAAGVDALADFCAEHADWLDDYALFMALRDDLPGKPWNRWPKSLVTREDAALKASLGTLEDEVVFHQFTQYVFFSQWSALRDYAHQRGVRIVGDIPFYVALDSADVWAHPRNFALDPDTGEALLLAGVPPDYFSATGQLWNTPVYDWEHLASTRFAWWVARFRRLLELVDIVRIDHFRGFAAFWQVPHGAPTAMDGTWVEAPGAAFFTTLRKELGELPIWAEDLGFITDEVTDLREQFGFPGMKVLQFAFDDQGAANSYLPFHYERNFVCYTATHDNDTTRGWWAQLPSRQKQQVVDYCGHADQRDIHWSLIRLAMGSVADDVVLPWQDVLGLGTEARLNVPGTGSGNWVWRYDSAQVTSAIRDKLAGLTRTYGR